MTGLILSLRYRPVQQYFGRLAADFLSRELNAQISIDGLYAQPFTSIHLQKLFISDQQGDTLFYASDLRAGFDLTRLIQQQITIGEVTLKDAHFNFHLDPAGRSNLAFLIEYFRRPQKDKSKKIHLDLYRIDLSNISFNYVDERSAVADLPQTAGPALSSTSDRPAIDFDRLSISGFYGVFSDIAFSNGRSEVRIRDLRLQEQSGFRIEHMDSRVIVDSRQIELRDLDLRTNRSHIRHYILLSYQNFSDFGDFIHKVHMQLELENTEIASSDIAYFAPELYDIVFDAGISGSLSGTVPAIQADGIRLRAAPATWLEGNLSITGLPEIEETVFDIAIDRLRTNTLEIETLVPQLSPHQHFDLPDFLNNLGTLTFKGSYQGHYNNFQATGQLLTDLGALQTDLSILLDDQGTRYQGELSSSDFDLAGLVETSRLGRIGFSTYIDGVDLSPDSRELWLNAQVQYVDFDTYRYSDLSGNASLIHNDLSGRFSIRDPNLRMDLEGSSSIDPDSIVHDLYAELFYADLHTLGFYERDSIIIHAATAHSSLNGRNLNDLTGHIELRNLLYGLRGERHHLGYAILDASGDHHQRSIQLQSEAVDASLKGQIDFYTIGSSFRSYAGRLLPALYPGDLTNQQESSNPDDRQNFQLDIHTKVFDPVAALISPNLVIGDSSVFKGNFNSTALSHLHSGDTLTTFVLDMPLFRWGAAGVRDLHIVQSSSAEQATAGVTAREVQLYGQRAIEQLEIQQQLADGRLHYQILMNGEQEENHAKLTGNIIFQPDRRLQVYLQPSQIMLYGSTWEISESAALISREHTWVQSLEFHNNQQHIQISGMISDDPEEQLDLLFEHFELNTIDPLVAGASLNISGLVSGRASIRSLLDRPYAVADIRISQAKIDKILLGNLAFNADFDQDQRRINLAIDLSKDNKQQFFVGGVYHVGREDNNLDLLARFDQTELDFLQVILKDLISDVKGSLTGQANITGTPGQLIINGNGMLQEAAFTVSYLQTPYRANGPIRMENTVFSLDQLALTDPRGQHAQVTGQIDMQKPTNPAIDANITATNFLVLQTEARHNPLYYGTAYGTGRFQFRGRPDAMNIQINARTEENTVFNIPLNSSGNLGEYEFIRFTSFEQSDSSSGPQTAAATVQNLGGLRMNIDLQVTPGATTNIYTDLGELSGRGEGQIALSISSLGDFEMFGDYLINSGKFTFSAQDFINKIFEIKQGGNIRWSGNPTEATIGLTAFYEQRTSLSPLYDAAGRTTNEQRVIARAEMELSGNLMRPGINFGLDFPADPYVKDELQSYLSDANNVNQQALSLIVRRSFIPGSTSDFSRELNSTLLSAGTELAFNQLNNIISQSLNLTFIDFNIRSLNDASASLRLFNDRLILTGGITDLRNQRLNDLNVFSRERIATDAELLYLIRQDGRLILRGSNRLNTRHFLLNPSDEYISALGLIYRQEFDTFGEFFRRKK